MISTKNKKVLGEIFRVAYHPLLIIMIFEIENKFNEVVITSSFRRGDKGVHGCIPCRGLDIRSWIYNKPEDIVDFINERFTYDPNRIKKCCAILHKTNGGGIHIHLQVHSNTTYNKGK